MSTLEVVALVAVAAWLAGLTLVVVLLVRQIGLLTVRLDRDQQAAAPVGDGVSVGSPLPVGVASLLDINGDRPAFILILGAVCAPCREMASELGDFEPSSPVLALISGNRELATELSAMLPTTIASLIDPAAERAVRALEISTTPFVFEVRDGSVAAKAALRGAEHLKRFIDEAESVPTHTLHHGLEVHTHGG